MKEEQIRLEISHILRRLGIHAYHPPDRFAEDGGRIDIYGMNPVGPCAVIEVKDIKAKARIEPYAEPQEISRSQRRWLDWWCYGMGGKGFIAFGTVQRPRRLWIIPWKKWVEAEKKWLEEHIAGGGTIETFNRVPISFLNELDTNEWVPYSRYEVSWVGGEQKWDLLPGHPLANIEHITPPTWDWENPISLRFPEKEGKLNAKKD